MTTALLGKVVGSLPRKHIDSIISEKRKTKLDLKHKTINNIYHDLMDIVQDLKKINHFRKLSARMNLPRGFTADLHR